MLARHVGLAERQEGSFAAGAAAVSVAVLHGSACPSPATGCTTAAASPAHDRLSTDTLDRGAPTGRQRRPPRAARGGDGAAGRGLHRLADVPVRRRDPTAGRGRVRAKTGTLTGVHGLAGVADDATAARMAFVVVADRVRPASTHVSKAQTRSDLSTGSAVRVGRVLPPRRRSGSCRPVTSRDRPSRPSMVDWDLAVRVGSRLAGEGPAVSRGEAVEVVEELRAGAERSRRWSASSPASSPASAPRPSSSSTGPAGSRPTPTASRP